MSAPSHFSSSVGAELAPPSGSPAEGRSELRPYIKTRTADPVSVRSTIDLRLSSAPAARPSLFSAECHLIGDIFAVCIVPPRQVSHVVFQQEVRA